jgi:hypothetical protein
VPFPNPETQWKPGESGNPAGYARRRRIADAIGRLIDDQKLDRTIALTAIAMMLGDKKPIKGRKPSLAWFKMIRDMIDGPLDAPDTNAPVDLDEPKRIVIPDVDDRLTTRED